MYCCYSSFRWEPEGINGEISLATCIKMGGVSSVVHSIVCVVVRMGFCSIVHLFVHSVCVTCSFDY